LRRTLFTLVVVALVAVLMATTMSPAFAAKRDRNAVSS
jgi:hypothetical protein